LFAVVVVTQFNTPVICIRERERERERDRKRDRERERRKIYWVYNLIMVSSSLMFVGERARLIIGFEEATPEIFPDQ